MKILIDSHVLIWLLSDVSKISPKVLELLSDTTNRLYISWVSLMEISIKQRIGKLSPAYDFGKESELAGIEIIYADLDLLLAYKKLPDFSWQDPFDHMLIAHAISNKLIFCTADKNISNSKVVGLKILKP